MAEQIEFIDCGSLNIKYDATGKATISLTVIKNNNYSLQNSYGDRTWGGVHFDTTLMQANQQYTLGTGGWRQWQLQFEGVGN